MIKELSDTLLKVKKNPKIKPNNKAQYEMIVEAILINLKA